MNVLNRKFDLLTDFHAIKLPILLKENFKESLNSYLNAYPNVKELEEKIINSYNRIFSKYNNIKADQYDDEMKIKFMDDYMIIFDLDNNQDIEFRD